jgi:hypothetical protein
MTAINACRRRKNSPATRYRGTAVVESHDLADIGQPGDGWGTAGPAALERVLLHLVQEYARHRPGRAGGRSG